MENEKKVMDNYVEAFGSMEALIQSADEQMKSDVWQKSPINEIFTSPIKGTTDLADAIPTGTPEANLPAFIGESEIVLTYSVGDTVEAGFRPLSGSCFLTG